MMPDVDFQDGKNEILDAEVLTEPISVLEPRMNVRVGPDTPIKAVLQALIQKKHGAALVVEQNELIGIFTERDLVNHVALDYEKLADSPVRDFMRTNPSVLRENHSIAYALNLMSDGGYRHIPVLDDQNHPTGILSVRDIIRYIDYKWLNGAEY